MIIYLGADHGGFPLKGKIKETLAQQGYDVVDDGADHLIPDDDYPDYAAKVAQDVAADTLGRRGILICRSGFGMDIVANKFRGIRAALATSSDQINQGRHDDDVNVLVLPADYIDETVALQIVTTFLATPFAKEERYQRRLDKIAKNE